MKLDGSQQFKAPTTDRKHESPFWELYEKIKAKEEEDSIYIAKIT